MITTTAPRGQGSPESSSDQGAEGNVPHRSASPSQDDVSRIVATKTFTLNALSPDLYEAGVAPLFEVDRQCRDNWCWAAVGLGIAQYSRAVAKNTNAVIRKYGRIKPSQCEIAFGELSQDDPGITLADCCEPPCGAEVGERIDLMWSLEAVLDNLGASAGAPRTSDVQLSDVRRELDGGRPVCARVSLGDGHFVASVGHQAASEGVILLASDPFEYDFVDVTVVPDDEQPMEGSPYKQGAVFTHFYFTH